MNHLPTRWLRALLCLGAAGCRATPDPQPLPADTFTCLVAGTPYVPYLSAANQPFAGPKIQPLQVTYDAPRRALRLNTLTVSEQVECYVLLTHGLGDYALGTTFSAYPPQTGRLNYGRYAFTPKQTDPYGHTQVDTYFTNPPAGGTFTLTRWDSVARTVAGRFAFTAANAATGKQVAITGGEFFTSY